MRINRNLNDRKLHISKIILPIISFIISFVLLKEDFFPFLSWWLVLLILGIVFLPITDKVFHSFHDNGYLFSKVIGLALSGYTMWLLSSIKVLKFKTFSCILILVIMILINLLIYSKSKSKETRLSIDQKKLNTIYKEELFFFILFFIWIFIRGFKPEAYGTEKFMDYGFMTSMMRADYMPPQDFWFSGGSLNYYYLGQFFATFLTKLSFVPVSKGYNLMLMTLAAFGFVLPYSLVYNITKNLFVKKKINYKYAPSVAGMLSGAFVSLAGNLHFTLFYWIVPIFREILGIENDSSYWFSDSTRYIGYHPETADKTIHEFPSYSFLLGDLHAHVLNIIFVLTLVGVLYGWFINSKKIHFLKMKDKNFNILVKEFMKPEILLIGFFIGLFHMTNFWDFPIYFVVSGAVILFFLLRNYGFSKITVLFTGIYAIIVILISELIALPFTISFDQISTNILLVSSRTPFYQLIILWGLPVSIVISFIFKLHSSFLKRKDEKGNPVTLFLRHIILPDIFILILGLCAIGLVLIPELIYVEDIYTGDFKRANTMFKLTYQAFIMFGICSGYILVKAYKMKEHQRKKADVRYICLILLISTIFYTPVAVKGWYGDIRKIENYQGIDAAAFMKDTMPDDYLATNWLMENVTGMPIVLEANGDSYSDYQRVSVITGLPTVLGWYVHEWLWRGDTDLINQRSSHIERIYTSNNKEEILELIEEYKIEYIYVGKLEQEKYENLNHEVIKELGEVVFISPSTIEKEYETYIVSIH